MNLKLIPLSGIARSCSKIESALARKNIDLDCYFYEVDKKRCGLISGAKFFTVVYNQLGRNLGVCQEEVQELAKYFKKPDGRVDYPEFLNFVVPKDCNGKPLTSGLEWEDHEQVNVFSPFELRQLKVIITKIAWSCHLREIHLERLFEDYEKLARNNGTVTTQHFRRILYFAGITLGPKEFQVLVKRFVKYNYTLNYVAFVEEVKKAIDWFKKNKSNAPLPEKVLVANIDKLPRPEIGRINLDEQFGTGKPCHPCVKEKKHDLELKELMLRIKKHIYDNRIRTKEFFEKFDILKTGFVTKSQFIRGLESIGLSGLHRLYVAPHDLEQLFSAYNDNWDDLIPDRVNWNKFCEDIDEVFTIKGLEKCPYRVVECPPLEVRELPRRGTADWQEIPKTTKQVAQDLVFRLRDLIKSRRIDIETFFKGFDKSNHYHVSRCQMRRVFSSMSILFSEKEVEALMLRFGDDMGFNYWKFMSEVNDVNPCESKHEEILKILRKMNEYKPRACSQPNFSLIDVLGKLKGQVKRNRINIDQFMRQGELCNEGTVLKSKFRSNFSCAGIILDGCELDLLCEACKVPSQPFLVDVRTFCQIMNQAFYQTKLEKRPLTVPVDHVPLTDSPLNFLDFEERCLVSNALQKLSRHNDISTNIKSFFADRAKSSGTVSMHSFKQVLKLLGLEELLTPEEVSVVFKSFSLPAGTGRGLDYKNFLVVLAQIRAM